MRSLQQKTNEPITYHQVDRNYFWEIRPIKNISNLNNEEFDEYVEENGRDFEMFIDDIRNSRITNTMTTRGTYWKHQKALEKAEECYNYRNTSLGFRCGCTLQDEQQGKSTMTNIGDIIGRFKILLGERTSDNKNNNSINEFKTYITTCLRINFLTKNIMTKRCRFSKVEIASFHIFF